MFFFFFGENMYRKNTKKRFTHLPGERRKMKRLPYAVMMPYPEFTPHRMWGGMPGMGRGPMSEPGRSPASRPPKRFNL